MRHTTLLLALLVLSCQTQEAKEKPKPPLITKEIVVPPAPEPKPEPEPPKFEYPLGSYQTVVKRTEDLAREHNVEHAASKFDGLVLQPGDDFSFNEVVGKRSKERGFKDAPVIWDGLLVPGVGGGTCQVSSTLHAALLSAGLTSTERHPHSRPSSYIPIGYDATVSWPDVCETDPDKCFKFDLKFENTFEFPIKIDVAYTTPDEPDEGDVLQITFFGTQEPTKIVEFRSSWYETGDYQVVEKPKGWGSRRVKLQDGRKGRRAILYVTSTDTVTDETTVVKIHSKYKPTNEIWEVGPDYEPPKEDDGNTEGNDPEGRAGVHPGGEEEAGREGEGDLPSQPSSP